ncbi:SigE family RNA polymerase sigma factor [Geodermatophilus normandii]|uniref:SigE family RNA polymerase sigma factor n=1 Tax=Geodermatophilus normandii TaxID=1137989 RepID=A0A6P0GM15_9ACTN|nr:SigE family RNA polymerase sigma factor [Geodermatophilus normandii]NEM08423.1 SigE family RNA polymerase sigma factor [Geodermatophilus normandii]
MRSPCAWSGSWSPPGASRGEGPVPDDDGFTEFVLAHRVALLRTACLLTADRALGEDLVQTTLLKTYARWDRVRRADDPPAYVHRVMISTQLSRRRRLSSGERPVDAVPDRGGADPQAGQAVGEDVRRALARLSPRVRTTIVLRYFADHGEAETARLMGCSVSTVGNHVRTGLAALRTVLTADEQHTGRLR